jgi:hypothetical protein
MAGLVPAIRVFDDAESVKAWVPGKTGRDEG